jgi:hypothetical protein
MQTAGRQSQILSIMSDVGHTRDLHAANALAQNDLSVHRAGNYGP